MKNTCPGCSRHCTMDHPHCKYGRQYFEKQKQKEVSKTVCPHCPKKQNPDSPAKWEAYVQKGGTAWQLLYASRMAKKALRKKQVNEQMLLHRLSAEEREQLAEMLSRLDFGVK